MTKNQKTEYEIRFANNHDVDGVVALIGSVLQEYDDDICLAGSEADLLDIEANFAAKSGAFWVIDPLDKETATGVVFGTHATLPDPEQPKVCNFKRLYVDPKLRGTDWSHRLMQVTIDWAKENNFERVEFWSDVRFHRAHRFFEKFGFKQLGEVRTMTDSHEPYQEYLYFLNL